MTAASTICICGAGTMGSGIAQVFAAKNFSVTLYDVNAAMLRQASEKIDSDLQKLVAKQKISETDRTAIQSNIRYSGSIHDCSGDLVIEAIIENLAAKQQLINQLFSVNNEKTIIATNTSSLSVTKIAASLSSPERFAGMHFFNPAPLMQLVEIVKTNYTDSATVAALLSICQTLGKKAVLCNDSPGFIVNRVARPYYLEALHLVQNENANLQQVDMLMETTGFRMGPFKLMDLIGNDVNYSVTSIVYEALNKPSRLQPSTMQEQLVKEGKLGRKSGKGYYEYTSN